MAAKSKQDKVAAEVQDDSRRSEAGTGEPFSQGVKSPDELRNPTVSTTDTTFDERTGVTQPFVTQDGRQDNGQKDLDTVDGARAGATRVGGTTVEETDKAISKGIVEGEQNKDEL